MRVIPNWDKYIEAAPTEDAKDTFRKLKKMEERKLEIDKLLGAESHPETLVEEKMLQRQEKLILRRLKELDRLMGI